MSDVKIKNPEDPPPDSEIDGNFEEEVPGGSDGPTEPEDGGEESPKRERRQPPASPRHGRAPTPPSSSSEYGAALEAFYGPHNVIYIDGEPAILAAAD